MSKIEKRRTDTRLNQTSFAAPNMTAIGTVNPGNVWDLGQLPSGFHTSGPLTIEAWVQPAVSQWSGTILNKPGEFAFGIVNGYVAVNWATSTTFNGQTPILGETWTHIAITYDGQTVTLFVDGAPDLTMPFAGPFPAPSSSDFCIGPNQNNLMDIWGLTIYDYPRDAATEGKAPWVDFEPAPGVVANYDFSVAPPFETMTGLQLTPQTGAVSQTLAPSIRLDGKNAGVTVGPYSFGTKGTKPKFTVSVWVAPEKITQPMDLFFADTGSDQGLGFAALSFAIDPSVGVQLYCEVGQEFGTTLIVRANISINPGDWHNVAMTFDGEVPTLFFDGQAVGSREAGSRRASPMDAVDNSICAVGYGRDSTGQNAGWLTGNVQWLSIWSRALSPDEIVYQQYGEVGNDVGIVADVPMDAAPAQDITKNLAITLIGTAVQTQQRVTVTSWLPPPAQLHPPTPASGVLTNARFAPTPMTGAPKWTVEPFSDEHLALAIAELKPHLAQLDDLTAALMRGQFEERTRAAFREARENPESFQMIASWRREGDEEVFVHHHPQDGDIELMRVQADSITACQMWWATFTFTLLTGILGLLFLYVKGKVLTEWLQRYVLNDETVLEALATAFNASPGFTAFTVLKLLSALYAVGLLKSFFWFVAYQAGYFAVGKAFAFMATKLLVPGAAGAAVILFATQALLLAVNLGLQVTGAPNIPGYSASCGSSDEVCDRLA